MRRFVVFGHEAPTEPGIKLNDLPGSAGRLDVLARCVTAGLLHSHGIRETSEVVTILQNDVTIRFAGTAIRHLRPDERSTAARFDAALEAARDAIGHVEVEASPGVTVSRHNQQEFLATLETPIIQLHPDGTPIPEWTPTDATFVLSDHMGFTEAEGTLLDEVADERLSVGPQAIHADQAIGVVHNYLDTAGYQVYD